MTAVPVVTPVTVPAVGVTEAIPGALLLHCPAPIQLGMVTEVPAQVCKGEKGLGQGAFTLTDSLALHPEVKV